MECNIGIVIVTFNRLDKLKIALEAFEKQTLAPRFILVVDNKSTDGTDIYLNEWQRKLDSNKVITLESNLGGSGGFYSGLKESLSLNADWIWVSDDDAYPNVDAIEEAQKHLNHFLSKAENISAICGKVINRNKDIAFPHRRTLKVIKGKTKDINSTLVDYKKEYFEINVFSYVGSIINKEKLSIVGLTKKDYFIWFDDSEHSLRLSKVGKILCCPSIIVDHDAPEDVPGYSWKTYYGVRNELDAYKDNFGKKVFKSKYYERVWELIYIICFQRNIEFAKLYRCAINDGKKGKLGIHPVYRPGWKPKNKQ